MCVVLSWKIHPQKISPFDFPRKKKSSCLKTKENVIGKKIVCPSLEKKEPYTQIHSVHYLLLQKKCVSLRQENEEFFEMVL